MFPYSPSESVCLDELRVSSCSVVLQPIHQLNVDKTSERPLEAIVVLTFHDERINRQVAALTTIKFLGIEWGGAYYVFTVLPFGLSTACYVFTKLLRTITIGMYSEA